MEESFADVRNKSELPFSVHATRTDISSGISEFNTVSSSAICFVDNVLNSENLTSGKQQQINR